MTREQREELCKIFGALDIAILDVKNESIKDMASFYLERFEEILTEDVKDCKWMHDGCDKCKYITRRTDEQPCRDCKQNYKDKWEMAV